MSSNQEKVQIENFIYLHRGPKIVLSVSEAATPYRS
jgi:hypothetical protein